MPGRAVWRHARRVAPRSSRRARLRCLSRHRRSAGRRGRRPIRRVPPADRSAPAPAGRPGPPATAAAHRAPRSRLGAPRTAPARRIARRPISSSPPAAIGAARSAPSRPSAARSCRGRRRGARRGPVARRHGRPRAGTGQRELDVLRQGPRRPAGARSAAPAAGRGRRHRAGPGDLPAAGRAAPDVCSRRSRPRRASRRTSICPSSTPAGRAAPDAAVRLDWGLPRPARAHPPARAATRARAAT